MFIYKHTPRRTRLGDLCPSPAAITTSLPRSLSPYSRLTALPSIPSPPCSLRGRPPVRLFFFLSFTIIQIRPCSPSSSCRFRSMLPQRYLLFLASVCNSPAQSLKRILIQAPFLHHVKKTNFVRTRLLCSSVTDIPVTPRKAEVAHQLPGS